uniref:Uncharacterized protein n=1 Tax=Ditylenchus dipsaci TaxID=166011 RepID=A0A915CQA8_9BILA
MLMLLDKICGYKCNDHRGQCRSMYKLYYFPVIFGYVMGGVPIVYNQPITTDYLFSWVSHLLMPDEQINNLDDFNHFTEFHDYSVIGYLPLESGSQASRAFNVFLMSAYKSAGSRTTTGFASFQSSVLAEKLGFEFPHQLKFYTSVNGQPALLSSLTIHKTIRSDGVVKWIQDNMHFLEYKAVHQLNFEEEELGGKSEMLFRKLNSSSATIVLFSENYGLPYFTDSNNALRQVAKTFHSCESAQHTVDSMNLMRAYLEEAKLSCLLQHNKNEKIVDCCASIHTNHLCVRTTKQSTVEQGGNTTYQCLLVNKVVDQELFHRKCCAHYASNNKWSNTYKKPFHFSLGWKSKQSCRFLRLMRKTQSEILKGYNTETNTDGQSDHSPHTASIVEGLGFNKINLDTFLHNYITDGIVEQKLTASSFTTQILNRQNSFDSLVFFTGGRRWHGPSQVVSYILHSTKHYFNQFDSLIHFYCLDASKEKLPWQYTFDSLPALVFFPAYRSMESSLFPRNLPLSIPNLMAFLLSRVQPELRFRLAISGCTSQCLQNNLLQISQFQHNIGEDVRSLRRLIRRQQHTPLIKSQFRLLIRRRNVQKRSAAHLHKMLELFQQTKHQALNKTVEDVLVSDTLFMKWLVTNRLGLTFRS